MAFLLAPTWSSETLDRVNKLKGADDGASAGGGIGAAATKVVDSTSPVPVGAEALGIADPVPTLAGGA